MRDHSMFNFLVNDASSNSMSLDVLHDFAKQAAHEYMASHQTPLNESISKIASTENLSPEHVAIVCQEANKLVHTELFKTAEDKYTVFDIAKPEEIISNLENTEKVASFETDDYDLGPDEGQNDFSLCKTAGHSGFSKSELSQKKEKLEKLAFQKQEIADQYYQVHTELEKLENQFVKIARNMLLPYRIDQRRDNYSTIATFCKKAGVDESTTSRLINLLDKVMESQGLIEKTADSKVSPDLISENLNVRIINGDHPLYVVVKTIPEVRDKMKLYQERYNWIQEQVQACNADGAIIAQHGKRL